MNLTKSKFEKVNFFVAAGCLVILGVLIGKYQERMLFNVENVPMRQLEEDINLGVPMVRILGIQDGELLGEVSEVGMRVVSEEEVALVNEELQFRIDVNSVLRKDLLFHVPEGMNYVGSKKGKRFYNVYDKQAEKIAPENRIFWQRREDALVVGYLEAN